MVGLVSQYFETWTIALDPKAMSGGAVALCLWGGLPV